MDKSVTEYDVFLDSVSVRHRGVLLLSDITLKIPKGQFCYLIGKTGSGKSSLMRALYADFSVAGGRADVVGYDLHKIRRKQVPFLRRKIGMIFQDFKLFEEYSVYENLQFVLRATGSKDNALIREQIESVLQKVGLETKDFKMLFQLSGGERQRVGIARALLNDPDIIIADEPTCSLDPQASVDFMELLETIHQSGKSVLMATHNYALIMKFPHLTFKCENQTLTQIQSY